MNVITNLRKKFLEFYRQKNHVIIPSSSLIPENDASTLFTSSGMQPLINYFFGAAHPAGQRLSDSQKCFRSVDIEEVGDNRHTTFFEMLGNWSFGDYFKQQQLPMVWEFFTKVVGLQPSRLYVTVFSGDKKFALPADKVSIKIWQKLFAEAGIEAKIGQRIFHYDSQKNWWSRSGTPENMPAGEPGGADSEVFYDFGAKLKLHEQSVWKNQPCHPNCDCGRFVEIGNSVFMEYQKTNANTFVPLPQKNVDYGGGLERLVMAMENQSDIFQTSVFTPLIKVLQQDAKKTYPTLTTLEKKSWRIIADHTRSAIMLLADGVIPSNKQQGYVLRRLLRKSLLMLNQLNLSPQLLEKLVAPMVALYGDTYQEVKTKHTTIKNEIQKETSKFNQTLKKGLAKITKLNALDGKTAFFLYETYGFPFELTQEIAAERGLKVDKASFRQAQLEHQQNSRAQSGESFRGGLADHERQTVKFHTATHLLLASLRQLIDQNITQKGSNITAERARFDFNFPRAFTAKEIKTIEEKVNAWIKAGLPVTCTKHDKKEALEMVGGSAFAERYPDQVSVYTVEAVSQEICIGPHVKNTGEIGLITLGKQQSVSAGVRRLYLYFQN